jgi:non-canonical (house-cleaning) NTP pyrophosphatase
MEILLSTTSEIKYIAFERALVWCLESLGRELKYSIKRLEIDSGVAKTPYNNETYEGAKNRAFCEEGNEFDLVVGIESGIFEIDLLKYEQAYVVVKYGVKDYVIGISSGLEISKEIVDRMNKAETHREILNSMALQSGISKKDTWGHYTNGILSREEGIYEACRNALLTYYMSLPK